MQLLQQPIGADHSYLMRKMKLLPILRHGAAACLGCFALSAFAVAPEAPVPSVAAPDVAHKVICNIVRPDYPSAARQANESGTVELRIEISVTGQVENVTVVESTGYSRLDDSAKAALLATRCTPDHDADGKPVRVATTIRLTFQ
ncbi:energy transducer TonB [Burkholderia sp. LMG 32019]|uniref:energy transducer TonB n=1 Tax=Burkholderia sp. LMG 32019 TaxID=3158173 RepID=UPI003C2D80AD